MFGSSTSGSSTYTHSNSTYSSRSSYRSSGFGDDEIDPLEERRRRLEQAEREAKGDFSMSDESSSSSSSSSQRNNSSTGNKKGNASSSASSHRKKDQEWLRYQRNENEDESDPAVILNRQHNNFRAQAQLDLAMKSLLDTSLPRAER